MGTEAELRAKLLAAAKKIRHRGPDWSGVHIQVCWSFLSFFLLFCEFLFFLGVSLLAESR